MKFLVVGNGGREHAIASSLKKSSMVSRLFWTPGNAATGEIAENPGIASEDFESLLQFARKENIDITVVGPEVPLVNGMADLFQEHGLKVFGPKTDGAKIEGSKIFAKQLMKACNIPTAPFREFYRLEPALKYLKKASPPFVVKADGLAAGKGVIIAHDMPEAQKALVDMFENKKFGDSGTRVVIDGYMEGEEATVLALYDGRNILPLISSQDHKPVFDGDKGPNTGGMGAVAPAPVVTSGVREKVNERVLIPLTREFKERNIDYRGVIYVGLMIQEQEPYVLEFNCRLGDPEAEAVMPLLQSDFGSMVACTV
ncbi:MAG: phosphoribosylamine--glycine ligase, partial [Spirochaetota bacterium]